MRARAELAELTCKTGPEDEEQPQLSTYRAGTVIMGRRGESEQERRLRWRRRDQHRDPDWREGRQEQRRMKSKNRKINCRKWLEVTESSLSARSAWRE